MPGDVTSIPQPGTVGFSYPYTPTHYTPGSINPLTAPNWGAVGQTALEAAKMIQSGPLNPAVRAQMQAETMRYQEEQRYLRDLPQHPERQFLEGIGPEGVSFLPGAQGGQTWADTYGFPNKGGGGGGGTPPPPPPPTTTDNQPKPKPQQGTFEDWYAGKEGRSGQMTPSPGEGTVGSPEQPSAPMIMDKNGNLVPAPKVGYTGPSNAQIAAATTHLPPSQLSASAGQGPVPQGLQQPSQATSQIPSQFQAPSQPQPPPAPPAPTSNIPSQFQGQPQPQPSNIPSQFQDNTPEMQNWQATTNLHPVGDSKSALTWAQRFDSHFNRAAYQSQGGPGGTPAWTFFNKDGASTTVPVPQMVKNGYAAEVGATNLSMGLSASGASAPPAPNAIASDQGGYAGQPAMPRYGNVPGQPQDLTPQINPLTAVVSAGGPPATDLSAQAGSGAAAQNRIDTIDREDQQAHDTQNPSGVSRTSVNAWRAAHPEGSQEAQNQSIESQETLSAAHDAQASQLANASAPDGSKEYATVNGIKWFVADPTTNHTDESNVPYMIYSETPWQETHMTRGGKVIEYQKPGHALDQYMIQNGLGDPTHLTPAEKENAVANHYWRGLSQPAQKSTTDRLWGLHDQILNSQRMLDASHYLTPADWNAISRARNYLQAHSYELANVGGPLGLLSSTIAKTLGIFDTTDPNSKPPSPALTQFLNSYTALMAGKKNEALLPHERDQLNTADLDAFLPQNLRAINSQRMDAFKQTTNQAMTNWERIDPGQLDERNTMNLYHRIVDGGMKDYMSAFKGIPYHDQTDFPFIGPKKNGAAPTPTPTPPPRSTGVVPRGNSKDNPLDVSNMTNKDLPRLHQKYDGTGIYLKDKFGNVTRF